MTEVCPSSVNFSLSVADRNGLLNTVPPRASTEKNYFGIGVLISLLSHNSSTISSKTMIEYEAFSFEAFLSVIKPLTHYYTMSIWPDILSLLSTTKIKWKP